MFFHFNNNIYPLTHLSSSPHASDATRIERAIAKTKLSREKEKNNQIIAGLANSRDAKLSTKRDNSTVADIVNSFIDVPLSGKSNAIYPPEKELQNQTRYRPMKLCHHDQPNPICLDLKDLQ